MSDFLLNGKRFNGNGFHRPKSRRQSRHWSVAINLVIPPSPPEPLLRRLQTVERRIDRIDLGTCDAGELKRVIGALEELAAKLCRGTR